MQQLLLTAAKLVKRKFRISEAKNIKVQLPALPIWTASIILLKEHRIC